MANTWKIDKVLEAQNLSGTNSGDETISTIETKLAGSTTVTLQGNTFNGMSQLVKTAADGKLPAIDGSALLNLSSGFADPMTARGDIIIRNASNVTAKLGKGTNGQVLTSDGTDINWATLSSGGDVFLANANEFTANQTIKTATPTLQLKDSDCIDSDVNATIKAVATDTGSGTEDIDVSLTQQVAGTEVTWLNANADGKVTIGYNGQGTQVNTSLDPTTDGTVDNGLIGARWKDLYMSGDIKDGTYTYTLPNANVTLLGKDTNGNIDINNLYGNYATTAVGGTIVLTIASKREQFFTGILPHIVTMPDVTTLPLGHKFILKNNTTLGLRVNSSGGNIITILSPLQSMEINCIAITGTTAASWYYESSELKQNTFVGIDETTPIPASAISIDYTTRVLTITPPLGYFNIFVDGSGIVRKYTKVGNISFDPFTDDNGVWYFYFDVTGTPVTTQLVWDDFGIICPIYRLTWNKANVGVLKAVTEFWECHENSISADDHQWKHANGSIWYKGLANSSTALTGTGAPDASGINTCFSLSSGTIIDDNLEYSITNSASVEKWYQNLGELTPANITVLNGALMKVRYKGVAAVPELVAATRFPFLWNSGTNRLEYVNTSGARTTVTDQYFTVWFVYGVQDSRNGEAIRLTCAYAQYSTLISAQAVTWAAIQSQDNVALDGEIRPLYRLIMQTRYSGGSAYPAAVKYTALREVQDIRKLIVTQTTNIGGSLPATSVTAVPYNNLIGTNAQAQLNELSDDLQGYETTISATGTTVLLNTSKRYQYITGTATQSFTLPVTSTLYFGRTFEFTNNSTQSVTVNSSGGNEVQVITTGLSVKITCIGITLITTADWSVTNINKGSNTGDQTSVTGNAGTVTNGVYTNVANLFTEIQTISGVNQTDAGGTANFSVLTSTSHDINIGGSIGLGGVYNGASQAIWASVAGRKENATSNNYSGYLTFSTRANGGAGTEKMRINSDGLVGIGKTATTEKLEVVGNVLATTGLISGINATTLGKVKLFGNTSGDVTLQPNAIAGTGIVLTLPSTTGTLVTGGGTASNTNTGDQTTIVGITGTTAQFNTALTDGDFATLAGNETLTTKTLTAPKLGSAGYIADINGNEIIKTSATVTSAVNEITVTNAITGYQPSISATGGDTDIDLELKGKGTGILVGEAFSNTKKNEPYYKTDGVDDYLSVADNVNLNIYDSFTIFLKIKIQKINSTQNIFSKNIGSPTYKGYSLYIETDNKLYVSLTNDSSTSNSLLFKTTSTFSDNKTHNIIISKSSNSLANIFMVIDGIKETLIAVGANTLSNADLSNVQTVYWGKSALTASNYAGAIFFKINMFNYALTESNAKLYSRGESLDWNDLAGSNTNLLSNGTFETGINTDSWTTSGGATITYNDTDADKTGTYNCKIVGIGSGYGGIYKTLGTINKNYRMSFRIKATSNISIFLTGDATVSQAITTTMTTYVKEFVSPYSTMGIMLPNNSSATLILDDFSIVQLGCTAEFTPDGINSTTWNDKQNGLVTTCNGGLTASNLNLTPNNVVYKQAQTTVQVLTDGAIITPDWNSGQMATLTLAGNRTLIAPTNLKAGTTMRINITQDATGSRTLDYDTTYEWEGSAPAVLSTIPYSTDVLTLSCFDGISVVCGLQKDIRKECKGYLLGGYVAANSSIIDAYKFVTSTTISLSATTPAMRNRACTNSKLEGFLGGGYTTTAVATIAGFLFVTEASETIAATLALARYDCGSVNSYLTGYYIGGFTTVNKKDIDGITFATKAAVDPAAELIAALDKPCGFGSNLNGYIAGGWTTLSVDSIDQLRYSDVSIINTTAVLTKAVYSTTGVNSNLRGYTLAGYSTILENTINGFRFSDEATVIVSETLATAINANAGINSSLVGLSCGGMGGALSDEIQGLTFSTEATINPSAALTTARRELSGCQSGGYL